MGNLYNNVGATGLIAQSNHYYPVIMGDNIICWRLDGDNEMLLDLALLDHSLLDHHYWVGRCWTNRCWTGRPDRSPLHSCGGRLLNYVLTKCQMKGSTMSFLAPKYDLVDSEALLGRFAKYRLMQEGVLERHFEVDWERWVSFFCFRFLMLLFLLPSDLLTAPFF